MIYSALHGRAAEPFSLPRQSSETSVSSFCVQSLLPSCELDDHDQYCDSRSSSHSVRFVEEANTYYQDDSETTLSQRQALSYSKVEIAYFRAQHKTLIKTTAFLDGKLLRSSPQKQSPRQRMQAAFQGLATARTVDQVESVMAHGAGTLRPSWVGLERYLVTTPQARKQRRRQLLDKVFDVQKQQHPCDHNDSMDVDALAETIRLTSRSLTRPCRLWAHYLAQQSLLSE